MLRNLLKLFLITAVVYFIVGVFPQVYNWVEVIVDLILSLGKWGVIGIFACFVISIFSIIKK